MSNPSPVELLKLFEDMETQIEEEAPIPFYRKLLKHYDKAIKMLSDNKCDGEALTCLENERHRISQTMGKHIAERFAINLRSMKDELEEADKVRDDN